MNKIVLDTETTNAIDCPLVYDIGWAIINKKGKVIKTYSYVVAEIFFDEALMESAYFKEKIPLYKKEILTGERVVASYYTIKKRLKECCDLYGVKEIYAHNARFDYLSTTTTQRYLTKSKNRWFIPYGVKICDILKMSREVLGKDEKYIEFCNKNNYVTKNNRPRLTAEVIYRYISNNNDFCEAHTGLADVLIEKEIMDYCFARNPNVNRYLWE